MILELWRLPLWLARVEAYRVTSDRYLSQGAHELARAGWFVANVLLRRGPLLHPVSDRLKERARLVGARARAEAIRLGL